MDKEVRRIAPLRTINCSLVRGPAMRELEHVIQCAVTLANDDAMHRVSFMPTSSMVALPIGTSAEEATRRLVETTISE